MQQFENQVVIVTGAGMGIGRATALIFAERGARVVVATLTADRAESVTREIEAAGGQALAVPTDVSVPESVDRLLDQTLERFGTLDVLVNNAGIFPRRAWADLTLDDWDRIHGVNLRGMFVCCKAAAPVLQAKGAGAIVNLSSIVFQLGLHTDLVPYIASKGGIVGLTRALARELGRDGVRVNAVAPGAIQTEEEHKFLSARDEALLIANQSLKGRIQPVEVARVIAFLASSEASAMTGQTLTVDNGWAMS